MSAHHHVDYSSLGAGLLAGVISFMVNEAVPWAVHTIGSLATAGIVAVSIFFLNKWLRKKFGH